MKKSLIVASLLAFTLSTAIANAQPPCPLADNETQPPIKNENCKGRPAPIDAQKMEAKKQEFENKLKLTDEQKAQAKEIRLKGHEQMKPVFEKIKANRTEAKSVVESQLTDQEKAQKLNNLREELKVLKKEARDIRIKNMQEFEAILTPKQKKTLEKMKKEGKENFKKHHPKRPPCNPCPPCKKDCDCDKK